MKMYDVAALGELLVDFTDAGLSQNGMHLFEQNPGGAPANVLTGLSRMHFKTAFIGKVGSDLNGRFLESVLKREHIDTSGLIIDPDYFTTLSFVSLSKDGQRSFSFARKPGADTMLRREEVKDDILRNTKIFHIGSLSLTNEPSRTATLSALETAKKAGCIISYDPNYRASLWPSEEKAKEEIRSVLPYVDVIKLSEEETDFVTPEKDPKAAGKFLSNYGVKAVFITLGKNGAYVFNREGCAFAPSVPGHAIDTNGAGDCFCSGILSRICESSKLLDDLSLKELSQYAHFANAAASCCIEKHGAIPSMPTLEQINQRLSAV